MGCAHIGFYMILADIKNILEPVAIIVTAILLILNFSFVSIILLSILISISFKP